MKQKFKLGDLVYMPLRSKEIHKITRVEPTIRLGFGFLGCTSSKSNGVGDTGMQVIFHATPENHELLCKLYGVVFEAPPKRKEPKEVIQAMLESGKWHLVNYVVYGNVKLKNKVITKSQYDAIDFDNYFNKYAYCNVEVIDPKTGKIIIDFVDGEEITSE